MALRTVSDICVDANENKDDRTKLYSLLSEVKRGAFYYKETEVQFMEEHIQEYINELDPRVVNFDEE